MKIDAGQIIVWLIIGTLAGIIAGRMFRGRSFGVVGNLVIGLLGAILGGAIFSLLNIDLKLPVLTFSLADLIVAVVGALLLLFIMQLLTRRRR